MNKLFVMLILSIAIIIVIILCLCMIFTYIKTIENKAKKDDYVRQLKSRIQKLEKGRK